jgi:hypothetical protein
MLNLEAQPLQSDSVVNLEADWRQGSTICKVDTGRQSACFSMLSPGIELTLGLYRTGDVLPGVGDLPCQCRLPRPGQ